MRSLTPSLRTAVCTTPVPHSRSVTTLPIHPWHAPTRRMPPLGGHHANNTRNQTADRKSIELGDRSALHDHYGHRGIQPHRLRLRRSAPRRRHLDGGDRTRTRPDRRRRLHRCRARSSAGTVGRRPNQQEGGPHHRHRHLRGRRYHGRSLGQRVHARCCPVPVRTRRRRRPDHRNDRRPQQRRLQQGVPGRHHHDGWDPARRSGRRPAGHPDLARLRLAADVLHRRRDGARHPRRSDPHQGAHRHRAGSRRPQLERQAEAHRRLQRPRGASSRYSSPVARSPTWSPGKA